MASLTEELKTEAKRLGFALAGVCPAVTPRGLDRFYQWLEQGYAGAMEYLSGRASAYKHPEQVLTGARSLLMLALDYQTAPPLPPTPGAGRVSCYAWGTQDYHDVIHARLKPLVQLIQQQMPGSRARGVVDSAPLLEREFAQLAGLGWIGKNTLVIHPQRGSWFFLAAVLTDVTLDYDEPFPTDHCGTCRACLDACPTDAFPQPYVLDATRCISYLTIELREMVPESLRCDVGDWVFGCDLCQQVCPWNRRSSGAGEPEFEPSRHLRPLDLHALFYLDDDEFRRMFRHTPLWRAKRRGLLRNAAIVLGNQQDVSALAALERGVNDPEPLIRAACGWALRQMPGKAAEQLVELRQQLETDPMVKAELHAVSRRETNSSRHTP
jgi:epoxyqueuosine reductase